MASHGLEGNLYCWSFVVVCPLTLPILGVRLAVAMRRDEDLTSILFNSPGSLFWSLSRSQSWRLPSSQPFLLFFNDAVSPIRVYIPNAIAPASYLIAKKNQKALGRLDGLL